MRKASVIATVGSLFAAGSALALGRATAPETAPSGPTLDAAVTVYDNVTGSTGSTFAINGAGSFATPTPSGDDISVLPGTTNLTSMQLGFAGQNFDQNNPATITANLTVKFWNDIDVSGTAGQTVFKNLLGQFTTPVTLANIPAADMVTGAPGFAAFRPTFDLTTLVGPNGVVLTDSDIAVQATFTQVSSGNNGDVEITESAGRQAPLIGTSQNGNFSDFNGDGIDDNTEFWSFGTPSATTPAANFRLVLSGNVPEPASFGVLGVAAAGLVLRRRRRDWSHDDDDDESFEVNFEPRRPRSVRRALGFL